jgi:hypothetical protein
MTTPRVPSAPRRRQALAALTLAGLALQWPATALATQPVRQNLTQLVKQSDLIVSGTVKRVSDGLANGVAYTEVVLTVKGSARKALETGSEFSFRQWGLLAPRRMPNGKFLLPMQIEGMPQWHAGEQVVVFFNRPASTTGLRSPVGLNQGKFTTVDGRTINGAGNNGLFDDVRIDAPLSAEESALLGQRAGAVDESTLMNLVTRAVDGAWVESGVMR